MASFDFFHQMIKDQQSKEVLEKGKKPKLTSSVHQLRLSHNLHAVGTRDTKEAFNNAGQPMQMIAKNSCHGKPASKTSVKKLKRISLRDLRILVVAKGGYVILRTLEPAYKDISIITVVEDHEGNAVFFYATNITVDPNPDLEDVLPVGTVFILKEPCIQYTILGDCMVRCDCPSDMIVLHEGHEMFPLTENITWKNEIDPKMARDPISTPPIPKTSFEWKERGNALFKKGKFEYASRCYLIALKELKGLDDDGSLKQILFMNLSAVYLKQGFFEKALEFAQSALNADSENGKALFRAGRSLYHLEKYTDALQYFERCCRVCPDDEVTKKELKKTEDRLLEQKSGVFDMYKFFLADINKDQHMIDCSDYLGPIKIVKIPGKGRGVVAVKDIEPGTLLEVSKALVFTRFNLDNSQVGVSLNGTYDIVRCQHFHAKVAHMILKNPKTFGPVIYDLFNMYHPFENSPPELFCDPATKKEPIIDMNIIEGIIKTNAYGQNVKLNNFLKEPMKLGDLNNVRAGLYALASYFNHSCIPNAVLHHLNGAMFIKAIQFIKADEEVYLPYTSWQNNFSHRQNLCQDMKFQCNCQLCQQDRKVPKSILLKQEIIRKRCDEISNMLTTEYCNSSRDNMNTFPDLICEIRKLISEMDETYKNYGPQPLKIAMVPVYLLLCDLYRLNSLNGPLNFNEEIEGLCNVLKLFGFDHQVMLRSLETGKNLISPKSFLDPYVLVSIENLIVLYSRLGQNATKTKWIQILCILENIHFVGNMDVIKLKHQQLKDYL